MGLIKAAIILGAGGYALNKFTKSREGHSCGCSHGRNHNSSQDISQSPSNSNENAQTTSWTPGRRINGYPQLPEYRDEKSGLVVKDSGSETEGWVGDEKSSWVGATGGEKEVGGLRGINGA